MKFGKKTDGVLGWVGFALSTLVWLYVFDGFISGSATHWIILGLLPLMVHQIIGWVGVAFTILFAGATLVGWETY